MSCGFSSRMSQALGYTSCIYIPAEENSTSFLNRLRQTDVKEPIVLKGLASLWPAVKTWNKEHLLSRFGDELISVSVDLPKHGVPYLVSSESVRREMSFYEFCNSYLAKGHCYFDQHSLDQNQDFLKDAPISELIGTQSYTANFWLGKGTKSGMHFDMNDNFLVMVRGKKNVALASPSESSNLYPFPERTTKSQLDIEEPDFVAFPKSTNIKLWLAELDEGDVLFIPRAWWHYLSSSNDDYAISLNYWFGRPVSLGEMYRHVRNLGARYLYRIFRDFFVHGLFKKPYFQRCFSGPPDGYLLYSQVSEACRQLFTR